MLPGLPLRFVVLGSLFAAVSFGATVTAPAPVAADSTRPLVDGMPMVRSWTAGVFPPQIPADGRTGSAVVRIIVDENGAVTAARVLTASQPAFGEAAIVAIKQWTFSPGVDDGKYTAMCLDVPFEFTRKKPAKSQLLPPFSMTPKLVRRTPAALDRGPLGDCPPSLAGRGLPGSVVFQCLVGADGKASKPQIIRASHADYVLAALADFASWHFVAATQGDLTVATTMIGEVNYSDPHTPPRAEVLKVNGITAPDGSMPEAQPQPLSLADPIWPYDLLLKGQTGSADVEFTVQPNGVVSDVHVRHSTEPAFGDAVAAAIETWTFDPAIVDGHGVAAHLVKHAAFTAVAPDENGDAVARLVAVLQHGAISGRGLDASLQPIYRIPPVPPADQAANEKGSAVIEFVIDRDGRARLPRIVSASRSAYGWAAATAVSQWVFTPPTRGGKPAETKVQIPFAF